MRYQNRPIQLLDDSKSSTKEKPCGGSGISQTYGSFTFSDKNSDCDVMPNRLHQNRFELNKGCSNSAVITFGDDYSYQGVTDTTNNGASNSNTFREEDITREGYGQPQPLTAMNNALNDYGKLWVQGDGFSDIDDPKAEKQLYSRRIFRTYGSGNKRMGNYCSVGANADFVNVNPMDTSCFIPDGNDFFPRVKPSGGLSYRCTRKGDSSVSQIPFYERALYNRPYDRNTGDESRGGSEFGQILTGYDLSSLLCRTDYPKTHGPYRKKDRKVINPMPFSFRID